MTDETLAIALTAAADTMHHAAINMQRAALSIGATAEQHQNWAEDYFRRQQECMKGLDKMPPPGIESPRDEQLRLRPQPIMFTTEEGGEWYEWEVRHHGSRIFAVQFSDGSIFDTIIGWRSCP